MSISIKLNLSQLKHKRTELKGKTGMVDCLIIPIEENKLFAGEKGVYLDITGIEIKDKTNFKPDQKDTHLLKQSFSKDVYNLMTDEEKKSYPILGNAIDWTKLGRREPEPQQSDYIGNLDEHDDLPF